MTSWLTWSRAQISAKRTAANRRTLAKKTSKEAFARRFSSSISKSSSSSSSSSSSTAYLSGNGNGIFAPTPGEETARLYCCCCACAIPLIRSTSEDDDPMFALSDARLAGVENAVNALVFKGENALIWPLPIIVVVRGGERNAVCAICATSNAFFFSSSIGESSFESPPLPPPPFPRTLRSNCCMCVNDRAVWCFESGLVTFCPDANVPPRSTAAI